MKKRKILIRLLWVFVIIFILMNISAYFHAYKFTHFTTKNVIKTKGAGNLSMTEKIKTLFLGINNPRPHNKKSPIQKFE